MNKLISRNILVVAAYCSSFNAMHLKSNTFSSNFNKLYVIYKLLLMNIASYRIGTLKKVKYNDISLYFRLQVRIITKKS